MRTLITERFRRNYEKAPVRIQRAFDRQLALLLNDLRHPSLRAKKYDASRDIWQARVNGGWRFYFQIEEDVYYLINIKAHPK